MRSCEWETKQSVVSFSVSNTLDVPQRLTKLLKIGSSFAAWGVREVVCSNIFQLLEKRQVVGRRKFFPLLGARSQSGNDSTHSRASSTATPFVVKGLIAAAADREEQHLSTRQPCAPLAQNLTSGFSAFCNSYCAALLQFPTLLTLGPGFRSNHAFFKIWALLTQTCASPSLDAAAVCLEASVGQGHGDWASLAKLTLKFWSGTLALDVLPGLQRDKCFRKQIHPCVLLVMHIGQSECQFGQAVMSRSVRAKAVWTFPCTRPIEQIAWIEGA